MLKRGLALAVLLCAPLTAQAAARTFVYLHDTDNQQVYAFQMDRKGMLTPVSGAPFAGSGGSPGCGGLCQTMAYSGRGKVLIGGTGAGIAIWKVAKDGTLSEVSGSPFGPAMAIFGVAVVARGRRTYAYGSDLNNDRVQGYQIMGDGTATVLSSSPYPAGDGALGMQAVKNFVFVANQDGDSASAYGVAQDGSLVPAPGSPTTVGATGITYNLAVDPRRRFVYVPDENGNRVFGFAVDRKSGTLTALGASPFAVGLRASDGMSIGRRGRIGFVVGRNVTTDGVDDVQAVRENKDGTLTLLGVQSSGLTGTSMDAHGFDPTGRRFVMATSAEVAVYDVDRKTGKISEIDRQALSGAGDLNAVLIVRR